MKKLRCLIVLIISIWPMRYVYEGKSTMEVRKSSRTNSDVLIMKSP